MSKKYDYNQQMDIKYNHLDLIDVPKIVEQCDEKWFNQTLTKVNESVVRLGIVEGEYHWHKHENEDEFFFVLSGKLFIDLEDRIIELNPNQGTTISKGCQQWCLVADKKYFDAVKRKFDNSLVPPYFKHKELLSLTWEGKCQNVPS